MPRDASSLGDTPLIRHVPGYEGIFADANSEIYTNRYRGRVGKNGVPPDYLRKLSQHDNGLGYKRVTFMHGGKCCRREVHNLVCRAFYGAPPDETYEAQHRDGNPLNNDPGNLKWGLPKDNAEDRAKHGRTAQGERCGASKLTEAGVALIRARLAKEESFRSIARSLGINKKTVSDIAHGRTWRSL